MSRLEEPQTIKKLKIGAIILLVMLVAVELMAPMFGVEHLHHAHFGIDGTPGFFAWYGFVTCVAMVLVSKVLGYVLKKKEDYYDE